MNDKEEQHAVWNELLIDQRDENHDIRTELKHVRAANIRLVDANTRLQEDKEALTGEVKKLRAVITRLQDARLLYDIGQLEDRPEPETCPECESGTWTIGARTLCIDCGWAELEPA